MNILYAASNSPNSAIQLSRFLDANNSEHKIKIAAYKSSSPTNINIDWTLNCLSDIYRPTDVYTDNDYLSIYYEQVKAFKPDLIISDLEYYTSYIAKILNISIWQCSSSLINFALPPIEKQNLGIFKFHSFSINTDKSEYDRKIHMVDAADRNLLYSHYGDLTAPPAILKKFEWIRPYHKLGKNSKLCKHNITAGLSSNNKRVLDVLKRYDDSVAFTEFNYEEHHNVLAKDINITDEYFCNLKNSDFFVCQGQASFLADAFYNGKFSLIYPEHEDQSSIINSRMSEHKKTGKIITHLDDIYSFADLTVQPNYNDTKYLHEEINKL